VAIRIYAYSNLAAFEAFGVLANEENILFD
jgi:hypothetical protein